VGAHKHDHHGHGHHHPAEGAGAPFIRALALTLGFAAVEWLGGLYTGSLALMGDAGHMFSDSAALALAALAARMAQRPASVRHSYGLVRAEVIAGFFNGLLMLALIVFIVVEAIGRFQDPEPVAGAGVMAIAFTGILVNLAVAFMISRAEKTLNVRAAMLHVLGDLLGSFAALTAGAVVYFTGWLSIDPILSLVIAALILASAYSLLREALHVLMEGVPTDIQLEAVGQELTRLAGVRAVHDLHVWTIASGQVALSAHIELDDLSAWPNLLERARITLRERFAIDHVTLQPEIPGWIKQPYTPQVVIVPKSGS
jgi:cobalt-zinc-cadmium efflux system protein